MKKNGQKENCAPKSPKNHLREEKVAENDDQGAFRSEKKTNPTPREHSRGGMRPDHWILESLRSRVFNIFREKHKFRVGGVSFSRKSISWAPLRED